MAENNNITVYQTLHGYQNGHKLLGSSYELSDIDKRIMLNLSDYSGSGMEKGFSSYLTGYPLLGSKLYVFAKTWYADEMSRPGCVWTHSLLIDFTELWSIKNSGELLKFFNRPNTKLNYKDYNTSLNIKLSEDSPNTSSRSFYQLTCSLYENTNMGLVLLGDSSDQYENIILEIWSRQWPRLKRNFTFSTGSLSLRHFESQPFEVQVMPHKRLRSISNIDNGAVIFIDLESSKCDNHWIDTYRNVNKDTLQTFMVKYGSDVPGMRFYFAGMVEAFSLKSRITHYSFGEVKKFFNENFSDPSIAKQLKLHFLELLNGAMVVQRYQIIDLILSNTTYSEINWNFSQRILEMWKSKELTTAQLTIFIEKLTKAGYDDDVLSILEMIEFDIWIKFDLEESYFLKILKSTPELVKMSSVWKSNDEIQEKWFKILQKNDDTNWSTILSAMLDASSGKFASELEKILGNKITEEMIVWISKNDSAVPLAWYDFVRNRQLLFFLELSVQKKLNRELLKIFLEVSNPYEVFWKEVKVEIVESFLKLVEKTQWKYETTGVYTFFITASYNDNLSAPLVINRIIFQSLHQNLQDDIVDINSWERFKWSMGKDIYNLIEQNYLSKLINDKNKVPDWDRCEFLRRSFIVTILKYSWDPLCIVEAIKSENTFAKFVAFSLEFDEGHKLLKRTYKALKSIGNDATFHLYALKKVL